VLGRQGHHSLRPEKLLVAAAPSDEPGRRSAAGVVAEAIYLGSGVRLVVDLDEGPRVTVLQQNIGGRAHGDHGDRVFVSWRDADVVPLGDAPLAEQNDTPSRTIRTAGIR
jgi:putative spermidine/putrescine transport system ATP-binding protein